MTASLLGRAGWRLGHRIAPDIGASRDAVSSPWACSKVCFFGGRDVVERVTHSVHQSYHSRGPQESNTACAERQMPFQTARLCLMIIDGRWRAS